MNAQLEDRLIKKFIVMFDCDSARISSPLGETLFLVIGHKRNTKDDQGQWLRNGEPVDFDYLAEKVIASGATVKELIKSAKEYKRLQGMSWQDYFRERGVRLPPGPGC